MRYRLLNPIEIAVALILVAYCMSGCSTMGMILSSTGQSLSNSAAAPRQQAQNKPVYCNGTNIGGVVNWNCQ